MNRLLVLWLVYRLSLIKRWVVRLRDRSVLVPIILPVLLSLILIKTFLVRLRLVWLLKLIGNIVLHSDISASISSSLLVRKRFLVSAMSSFSFEFYPSGSFFLLLPLLE